MLDILVPEAVLQGAGIVAIVGKLEAAGMAQHVRMDSKGQLGGLAEPCNETQAMPICDRKERGPPDGLQRLPEFALLISARLPKSSVAAQGFSTAVCRQAAGSYS
jgi:hypothetical protein